MEKFDWTDVAILRSQAETKKKRAKRKKELAKNAPDAKLHRRLTTKARPVYAAHAGTKQWHLKGAKKDERESEAAFKRADKMASILTTAEQGPNAK